MAACGMPSCAACGGSLAELQTEGWSDTGKENCGCEIGFDSFEPYSSVDENGNYVGIDIELATEAFNRMGYQAEFQMIPWEEKARLLADGSLDCSVELLYHERTRERL